tara:strand:- start:22472 stop:23092 length:621 start_codon:yes stop_codon:yes gene_type:complete
MNIEIINVGLGNPASVKNMLKRIGFKSNLTQKPSSKVPPDLIILPGVGSFDAGMKLIEKNGWKSYLRDIKDHQSTNILGICLGMQLLCDGSEEGDLSGLGLISGYFKKFRPISSKIKVPHMGWNRVDYNNSKKKFEEFNLLEARYYFVHSYRYFHDDEKHIIGTCDYDGQFGAVINDNNITGFQFHPEKSHKNGMSILKKYIEMSC